MNLAIRAVLVSLNKPHGFKLAGFVAKRSPISLELTSRSVSICAYQRQQHDKSNTEHESSPVLHQNPLFADLHPKKLKKYLEEEKKYNGKLVYVGRLTNQLLRAKALSLSSSALGLLMLPFLNQSLATSSFFSQAFVYGTTGFFVFVTPLFAHFLSRRYVSRLYFNYDERRFKAVLFSFFMYEYKFEFGLDDVHVPDMPGMFTTIQVKSTKRNLFVDLNFVTDPVLVQKIYRYDEPFDVKKYTEKKN